MKAAGQTCVIFFMIALTGCGRESIQTFDLVRADGSKAHCGHTVPAFLPVRERVDPYVAQCVSACMKVGFSVESTFPPGLANQKIENVAEGAGSFCPI